MDFTEVDIRVRYSECDAQSVAHHSAYPVWMEIARTELLRCNGKAYRDLESRGVYFVVTQLSVRYRRPAMYDDVVRVGVRHTTVGKVRIEHTYTFHRGAELLAEAASTIACVDGEGRPRAIPDGLVADAPAP